MKKRLIFDFDGVLADSEKILFKALNYSLQKLKYQTISKLDFQTYSKIELLNQRKIGKIQLMILVAIARYYISKNIHDVKPHLNLLNILKECPNECIIVSSNSNKNIRKILGIHSQIFHQIIGNAGLNNKDRILKRLNTNSIYITDEVRDIEACHKVGMPVYACNWGVDSIEKLKNHNPTGLLLKQDDITQFF